MSAETTETTGSVQPVPHDVAELRRATLQELRQWLSSDHLGEVERCVPKLRAQLEELGPLDERVVMVAYGGGKDSAYTTAFVRAMQLRLFEEAGRTFRLRVVTMRHAGMPAAVMRNIDRTYAALKLEQDPDCEQFLIDGDEISPFHVDLPQRDHVVARNRLDVLVTGHRTLGDGRPTFCNACNLSAAHAFGLGASHDGGVDLIITGDSPYEQRTYLVWIHRLAERLGVAPTGQERDGFSGVLQATNNIGRAYFTDIYGAEATDLIEERRVHHDTPAQLRFFSIYDDTAYASGDHWDLLTDFLGFTFDELAFSFSESDCGNPALMAHIRGLKCERLYGRSYAEGLEEYVAFGKQLMRKKEFPDQLIEMISARYEGEGAVERMRTAMDSYALDIFGITEEQLVCMVRSPFTDAGAGLAAYVKTEQPHLQGELNAMTALLVSDAAPVDGELGLVAELERFSGLPFAQLRVLARRTGRSLTGMGQSGVVDLILDGDPHKQRIATRHLPDGPVVDELISGR
ncbi:PqqD family protein [Streptomyces sp. NPDC020898]|uniref:PqqD family protein n=1 Tax=Streptomyces sp. NPDC020898 TaxID=3365101 RepID=UPI0037A0C30D